MRALLSTLLLLWTFLGCETASSPLDPGPLPSELPDPVVAAFLEGTWLGISRTEGGIEDYLDFHFTLVPTGHLRVRVDINQRPVAASYAGVTPEEIRIEVADPQGNTGQFRGVLDTGEGLIAGTFTLLWNGVEDTGTFIVVKEG